MREPEFPGCMGINPLRAERVDGTSARSRRATSCCRTRRRGGATANAAGYYIHSAIHQARPADVHAVCHAHSHAGRAWSVFARPREMVTQDVCNLHEARAVCTPTTAALFFGAEEGARAADS